ncbi:hypothetical protein [Brevundimonas diminuta]|jgi:hypothetical protein|uniref:hypothetical protein n=1 Tax=Brevundimonas diminuta TaxID=293 RepID=UPI0030FC504C
MTSIQKMAAAIASLALIAGASAASAQSYSFNQPAGTAVTATGQLIQFVNYPGVEETVCNVQIFGTVGAGGETIVFNSYNGVQAPGDDGNLACGDSLNFPIEVTPASLSEIVLDEFIVGTRGGDCEEFDYALAYNNTTGTATFDGDWFGASGICRAGGELALRTNVGNNPVLIQ